MLPIQFGLISQRNDSDPRDRRPRRAGSCVRIAFRIPACRRRWAVDPLVHLPVRRLGRAALEIPRMIRRLAIAIAAAFTAVFLCAPSAAAQAVCGPYNEITKRLAEKFKERVVGRGIDQQNRMFEVWAGPDGWTILMTSSDMQSCVMAIGQKTTTWQTLSPPTGPTN